MARRKKRTAHDALRTQWQLTSDERPPLTFIGVQTRVYAYGTVLDDMFAIVRFIHLRGKAPRIVQEAVLADLHTVVPVDRAGLAEHDSP